MIRLLVAALCGSLMCVVTVRTMRRARERSRELRRFQVRPQPFHAVIAAQLRRYALALVSWSIAQGGRSSFSESLREKLCRAGLITRQAQEGFLLIQEGFIVAAFATTSSLVVAHLSGLISLSMTWALVVLLFFCISLVPHLWVWGKGREHEMRWEEEGPFLVAVCEVVRQEGIPDEVVVDEVGRWYGDGKGADLSFTRLIARVRRSAALGLDWRELMARGVPEGISPNVYPASVRDSLQRYVAQGEYRGELRGDSGGVACYASCADTMLRKRLLVARSLVWGVGMVGLIGAAVSLL